jgi:hypothetical protein
MVLGVVTGTGSALFVVYMGTAGICLFFGTAMVYLRVRDAGSELEVAFGPVRFFSSRIPYDRIESAEIDRMSFLHGWGVHGLPGFGVAYRVSGPECVRIELSEPIGVFRFRRVYIGTDEPERLLAHISSRISAE